MPFPTSPRVIYRNNPLAVVICQLRFPTILEISTEEPAAFQREIRQFYPLYQKEEASLNIPKELSGILAGMGISNPPELVTYKFLKEDSKRFISLTRDFIAISEHQYRQWEDFRQEILRAQAALEKIYLPAFYSRIGLRYQDIIDKTKLGLQTDSWDSLLNPALLGILGAKEVDHNVQRIHSEVLIKVDDIPGGILQLKHGLTRRPHDGQEIYVIDVDFFTEDRGATKDVTGVLGTFNRLAGYLFRWAITQRLHEALEPIPL